MLVTDIYAGTIKETIHNTTVISDYLTFHTLIDSEPFRLG